TLSFKRSGERILLIGKTAGWLGQSLYLRDICGREDGAPPPVDLADERRNGDFVRGLIESGAVTAVHDVSDGGLAVALAEMAMAGRIGALIDVSPALPELGFLFGEDQARYVVTAVPENVPAIQDAAETAGIACEIIGVTGGDTLTLGGRTAILLDVLMRAHEGWLPDYMAGADR
ncbi:MAG: AIR synthase-related protein, partial [Methylocella sp.]